MKEHTSVLKWSLLMAFLAIFLAFLYSVNTNDSETTLRLKMDRVLISLLAQEKSVKVKTKAKIAVGYGACRDLFVDGKSILGDLRPKGTPRNFNEIKTQDELLRMYAYFFSHGAAAERFVSNQELFDSLVAQAQEVPDSRVALGGNAPVMANRFAIEGADVLLAAKMSTHFRDNINEDITVTGDNINIDDVHLILEYKRNEEWAGLKSPRANRFIVHSDSNNPTLSSIEGFEDPLRLYKPDLLVIGGLQMMDNYPFKEGQRQDRLRKVRNQMSSQPISTRVHFEMASFVDETLLQDLTEFVIPYADSLGMNEQELPNLQSMLMYGNISVVSDSNPRTADTLDQMRSVYRELSGQKGQNQGRPLTRIHLHTLAYQAILVTKGSAWTNTRYAVAKASLTANRHVCASKKIDTEKALLLMDDSFATSAKAGSDRKMFNDDRPVTCWTEVIGQVPNGANPHVEICIAPNLVCAEAKQTAGCGDNISAAGLVLQV